jgi:Tfp pilus assembly protein PilF
MLSKKIIPIFYCAIAAVLLVISFQCTQTKKSTEDADEVEAAKWKNLGKDAHYAGMNTCRTCHEGIYQSFIKTGMGQSFARATRQKSAADFQHHAPLYDKYKDLYYQPYWQDTLLMVKEYRLAGKDTVYSRTEKIDYIIGSGHHTNSHLVNENGYVYQAPFTWFVQQGRLDFPPGFENGYNSRFSREIGIECMSCHNGYPDFEPESVNKFLKIPEGIDCERCHGPGSLHVKNKLAGLIVDTSKGPDYTIVNPHKLPFSRQIDVCQRCHLQGDAVLKDGKSFFDFRPGMKLSEVMDEFLPVYQNQEHGFLMAAHAERLQKSQCFLKTQDGKHGEKLNCITCHNPHISVKFTQEQYFIAKCTGCHQSVHKNDLKQLQSNGSNCVSCHMPKSSAVDIPHVNITDHYIRVVHPQKDNGAAGVGKFKGLSCINDKHPDALTQARAYMYFYAKFERKAEMMDSAWKYLSALKQEDHPADFIFYYYLKNDNGAVIQTAKNVKNDLKPAIANYQVGQAYFNLGQVDAAIPYFEKAVAKEKYNPDYRIMLATSYTLTKNFSRAETELNFVTRENPKIALAWNGLAFVDLATNRFPEADLNLKKSLRLDPDLEPAHINRIKYYIALNKFGEARKEIELVLKKNPANPDALALKQRLDAAGL